MASIIDNKIEEIVKTYAELVQKKFNVSSIYLYGSYANGTYSEDSDIDIAVVGEDFVGDPIEDTLNLMRLRRKVDTRIEPHPFTKSEFTLSNPYIKEIVQTGIKIM